jgi:hypothetical protein
MNLTRYFMVREPMDDKFGPADIPDVWNLAQTPKAACPTTRATPTTCIR